MSVSLYPDQLDLVTRVRQSMRRHKSVLMQSATGSGKTRMALDMISGAVSKGSTSMFCVPRTELHGQTMETVGGYGIRFGAIAPGYTPDPFAPVQIAMTPTLARRLDRVKPPKVLFVDEAHYGGADLDRVIRWAKDSGSYIVGLSATPMKTNGQGMGEWYETMVEGLPVADLIRIKRLSDFRFFGPSAPDLSRVKVRDGEYVQSQISEYMEGETAIIGDAVKSYRENAMGKLDLVFATSRKHAGIIVDMFRAAGIPAMMIDGTMDKDTRKRIIRGFAMREFTVLVNVSLLTFGFDLAQAADMDVRVESLTDLCPRKSLPLQMQVWGRGLRMGPDPSIIMDHANNWREHGFPDSPREWSLEGSKKRGPQGEKADPIKQCDIAVGGCGYVTRPGPTHCPHCGMAYPVMSRMVEEKEGELVEIDRAAMVRERKQEQGRADTLEALIAVGRQRGMKNPEGWARHVWAGRQAKRRA